MFLLSSCVVCGVAGPSPCACCIAQLRRPGPNLPTVENLRVLFSYENVARKLIASIKYRNHRQAVQWLARAVAVSLEDTTFESITWIPTTPTRIRQRGFDHAELLARAVGKELAVPVKARLVRSPGASQTGRAAWQRMADPPCFSGLGQPASQSVLVIDDVVTTGATLRSALGTLSSLHPESTPLALAHTPIHF